MCDICVTETYMIVVCASTGGGAESEAYYPQWRRINQSIERPSTLNESLIRLVEGTHLYIIVPNVVIFGRNVTRVNSLVHLVHSAM